jgi:hypothetical protein
MRAWLASWRGWPLAALVAAAGCLVAAGNWWSIGRAYDGDDVSALAAQAGERASHWLGWSVVALVVAVVLRAGAERRRRLDPTPPGGAR